MVDWKVTPNRDACPPDVSYQTFCDKNADVPHWEAAAYVIHANRATDPETPALWHQRLGHVSTRTLTDLVKHRKLRGINILPTHLARAPKHCEVCTMAKHNRAPFTPKTDVSMRPMQILHSDVCGPYPITSLGGARYVLTLMDDFTDLSDVVLLKTKDEAKDALIRLITLWEGASGYKAQKLYTDRGGEYIDTSFNAWLTEHGIKHEYSAPRTPQQNGKAERLNQTLNDVMRSMLFHYNTYLPLWGHAMQYAARCRNVAHINRLGTTPHESFFAQLPDVSNFRTFGCKVYARVHDTQRKKLDPKSQVGIYLGPDGEGLKCKVLVYNPELRRQIQYAVHTVRDIVTYESLPAMTGVSDVAQLHWGGEIPLPKPAYLPDVPEARLEPMHDGPGPATLPTPHCKNGEASQTLHKCFTCLDIVVKPLH